MARAFHISRLSWQTFNRRFFPSSLPKSALSFHSRAKIFKHVNFLGIAFPQSQLKPVSPAHHKSTCANEENINSGNKFVHPEERTIFVGKLNPISTEKSIKDYFSQFGVVEQVRLKPSRKLNRIWPYAYVLFKDPSSIDKVLAQNHQIEMRDVRVAHGEQNDKLRLTKIHVRNIPLELNDSHLKEHFSQFGEVCGVELVYGNPQVIKERYCFVEFTTPSAVVRALESPTQKIGDNFVEVRNFFARAKRTYIKGRAMIEVVPEDLKVEHLRDYFKQFGRLLYVDLIFHRGHQRNRDIAFLGFIDDEPIETITGKIGRHTIKGKEVIVKRAISDKGNEDRKVKVFVDRIPGVVTENDVRGYFSVFGDVLKMSMKRWGGKENLQSAILTFSDIAEVDGIMARPKHAIDAKPLIVKRIGWSA